MTPGGFPHSEIPGSKLVCSSPGLIAAYHVLHRLLTPRHPPSALSSLIHVLDSAVFQEANLPRDGLQLGVLLPDSSALIVKERTATCAVGIFNSTAYAP